MTRIVKREERYRFDVDVRVGAGIAPASIGAFARDHGAFGYVVIGTGRSLSDEKLANLLAEVSDSDFRIARGMRSNMSLEDLNAALEAPDGRTPGWIVAIGGGSTIDAGKLISLWDDDAPVVATSSSPAQVNERARTATAVPLLAVPTCLGSAAEVSQLADVVVNPKGVKEPVIHEKLFPAMAVLDHDLARPPAAIQAAALVDAVAHMIDPLMSAPRHPPPQREMMIAAIRRLVDLGGRISSRDWDQGEFTEFATLTHLAVRTGLIRSSTAQSAVHRIEHGLSRALKCRHGDGLAMLLPPFLEMIEESVGPDGAWLADTFAAAFQSAGMPSEIVRDWIAALPLDLCRPSWTALEIEGISNIVMETYGADGGLLGDATYDDRWVFSVLSRAVEQPYHLTRNEDLAMPNVERVFGGSIGSGSWTLILTPIDMVFRGIVQALNVEPRGGWFQSATVAATAGRQDTVILCPPPGDGMAVDAMRLARSVRGTPDGVVFIGLAGSLDPDTPIGAVRSPSWFDMDRPRTATPERASSSSVEYARDVLRPRPDAELTLRSLKRLTDGTRRRLRSLKWAGVDLVDLEASSVAALCRDWGVPLETKIVVSDHPLDGKPIWSRPRLVEEEAVGAGLREAMERTVNAIRNTSLS